MAACEYRDYRVNDEKSWLRCRVLAFLHTAYFDDVFTAKPRHPLELVAVDGHTVVGVCDVSTTHPNATIETIAVHPDWRRRGIGHTLLTHARTRLRANGITTLDAWTRDDADTLAWYTAEGFAHRYRYLHVYAKTSQEMATATRAINPEVRPRAGFFHADAADSDTIRAQYARVHDCNHFIMDIQDRVG